MQRIKCLAGLACVLVVVAASVAFAQRDAGAKARGEFGTGFWSPQYNRSSTTSSASRAQRSRAVESTYARRQPAQDREYRVSSYEPTPIAAGETVAIAKDSVRVMHGTNLVGTLEKGREFKVLRVVNGWLGAVVEEDGQVKRGWVWHQDVNPVAATSQPER
jgi:hypothetical protein